jgi:pyruvate/2-oxoglutarate dehydrogenase complex dihydrolipoamide acyltransferase (E2) component
MARCYISSMRFTYLIAVCLIAAPFAALALETESPLIVIDTHKETKAVVPAKAEPAKETPTTVVPAAVNATAKTPAAPKANNEPVAAAAAQTLIDDFPVWAVSKAGSDTTGQTGEAPVTPPAPAAPAAPSAPAAAETPKAPPAPASPTDKLWPRDTVPIFMRSCTGLHVEYLAPCSCVITKLMLAIPHDEFLELSAAGKIDEDKRMTDIRSGCLATPGKRKE